MFNTPTAPKFGLAITASLRRAILPSTKLELSHKIRLDLGCGGNWLLRLAVYRAEAATGTGDADGKP
jgi:hypothetical protein